MTSFWTDALEAEQRATNKVSRQQALAEITERLISEEYTKVCVEGETYDFGTEMVDVAYGAAGKFTFDTATGKVRFNNFTFGDPNPGYKKCGYRKIR